jgi:hypothetical protein
VLDVGGGSGVHAEWLSADGYDVELLDPVPLHVERAAGLTGVTARLGDARHLPVADGTMLSPVRGFPAYFHDPDEVPGEFADAGFPEVERYGLQGALWLYGDVNDWLDDPERRVLMLDALRTMESVPSLLGVSSHLLTVTRRTR